MQVFLGLKTRIIHWSILLWLGQNCLFKFKCSSISSVLLSPNKADEKTIFVPQCTESRPSLVQAWTVEHLLHLKTVNQLFIDVGMSAVPLDRLDRLTVWKLRALSHNCESALKGCFNKPEKNQMTPSGELNISTTTQLTAPCNKEVTETMLGTTLLRKSMAVSRIFPTSAGANPFSKPKNPTAILPTRRTHLLDMWMEKIKNHSCFYNWGWWM